MRAGASAERGSVTVELILLAPLLVLMLWFLVYCGRLSEARLRVEDAAHQAARAASQQRSNAAAASGARTTAAAALRDAGLTCRTLSVTTDGTIQPGTTVGIHLTCAVGLHDLAALQVPGSMNLTAHFTSPVDAYRGTATEKSGKAAP
ncbi:TadE/TadG family type IV pilus assembly protein [Streptomyces sp. ODS28]|uniref:TadE/TadG family type IV pilus assembly protein n=1 Tax=Streptomyces sp. ODS28 TaxID=3136688 RepID=UPI0031E8D55E